MMIRTALKVAVPVLFLAAGAFVVVGILKAAPPPAQASERERSVAVETVQIHSQTARAVIVTTGTVQPARELTVQPEVSARIVWRAPDLAPGTRLEQGDAVARLDARDFRLALAQEESRVRSAELEVQTEEGRRQVAAREWSLLGDGRPLAAAPLASRRPHLEAAQASLDGSRATVSRARLNLSRVTLRAPFNAVVVDARAEVGQLVSPSSQVVTLVGTDQLWVRASVPVRNLPDLDIPGVNGDRGSKARVIHDLGAGRQVIREGQVLRLDSQLDPQTRTAQLLIAVDRPFDEPSGAVPLLPGAYVSVELEGGLVENVIEVPRAAVRGGNSVWVVTAEGLLSHRRFDVQWGTDESLFVTSTEVFGGDRVVTSPLTTPLEGMRARFVSTESTESTENTGSDSEVARPSEPSPDEPGPDQEEQS